MCFCIGPNCKRTGHTLTDSTEVFTLHIMRTMCVHNYDDGKYKGMIVLSNAYVYKMASITPPKGGEKCGVRL